MATAKQLANALGIQENIASLLVARGLSDIDAAARFLHPDKADMISANQIGNMALAADRIRQALADNEKILIFGDYDCDGICAAAILTHYLRSCGGNVVYHIPRREAGYGLSESAVEWVVERYLPDLMITVDCGIASAAETEYAQDLGVDVIVTDHHEPQEVLPTCLVVNPKLNSHSALRDLCGAAVALKLVEQLGGKAVADTYLDLAALATVADVVPLLGENRIIVSYGLQMLQNNPRKGLRALIRSCDLQVVTAEDIGYRIAPRINALGRMNDEADVVELLLTDEDFVVRQLVEKVNAANVARQTLTKQLAKQAYEKLTQYNLADNPVIVLWDPAWESGVLGLVAAKLCNEFYRPVLLLTDIGDCYRGSARSIPQVNIFQALSACDQKLLAYGGHKAAAGLSISKDNIDAFTAQLNAYVRATYGNGFVRPVGYDLMLTRQSVTNDFYNQLCLLAPFGEGNPAPKFVIDTQECRLARIGDTHHVKCKLNAEAELVAFGYDYLLDAVAMGARYNLFCELSKRTFQNRDYLQLNVFDARVEDIGNIVDTPVTFGNYLKTILYPPRDVGTRPSTLSKEIAALRTPVGTLFVVFCAQSAHDFWREICAQGKQDLVSATYFGSVPHNPLNALVVSPTDPSQWQYYSSVVFVDAPLGTGYLAYVGANAPNPELVLLGNYAYIQRIVGLHLDKAAVQATVDGVARWQGRCRSLADLCLLLRSEGLDIADVYAHFYIAYELGIIKVGADFALSVVRADIDLQQSRVHKVLTVIQSRNRK